MVGSEEVILLDSGTTVYVMAQFVAKRIEAGRLKYLRVVTNSIAVADVLGDLCEVIILGGRVRLFRRDTFGPIVDRNIKMFRAHKAFIGADGITQKDGLMTTDENTSRIDEEMIKRSDEVILLIDSSKFEQPSFVSYSDLKDIDRIVTDMNLPDRIKTVYEKKGVRIYRASIEE
jgi:DeoR family fructose operon transcriptional repressor